MQLLADACMTQLHAALVGIEAASALQFEPDVNCTHTGVGLVLRSRIAVQTFISIQELIPTALKYDPNNRVTSSSILAGMVIMAASLLLFTI